MKLFFSKAERIRYLGFDDFCFALLGLFPIAGLGNVLFGGANPELNIWQSASCYGMALMFTTAYWVTSRFWVLQFRRSLPKESQTMKRIMLTLPVLLFSVVIVSYLSSLVEQPEIVPDPPFFYKVVMSYTLVLMVLAIYEGVYFFTKYRQSTVERERLAKENMKSQLSVLKQQMNPHFLFNSLNTLVNLIPEDSRKATLFTQRLSAVYRRILEWRHRELVTLKEEVEALQDYVFLMQTRFEDKLQVCWHWKEEGAGSQVQCEGGEQGITLPATLQSYRIVPLSIQLLVENAIKHNVVSNDQPLQIDIRISGHRVKVSNPLNLRTSRKLDSTGWGHQNLKARYDMVTVDPVVIRQTEKTYEVSVPIFPVKAVARAATA